MTEKKMPNLGFEKSEFSNRHNFQKGKAFNETIRALLGKLLRLDFIQHYTQREEMVRSFQSVLPKRDRSALPYDSHGIGTMDNGVFEALMAEISCLVLAYWNFLDNPCEYNIEKVQDLLEVIEHVLIEPETLKVVEMRESPCRYRIMNDRIAHGYKMKED